MQLSLHNFLCYKDIELDFSTFKKGEPILVIANTEKSNGIGKSALFQSLIWLLWGKIPRLSNSYVKNIYTKDNKVSVSLTLDNLFLYRERTQKNKNMSTLFKVIDREQNKELIFDTVSSAQEYIESYLNMSYNDFAYLHYFDSYSFLSFFSLKNSEKKIILEKIFNIDIFDKLLSVTKFNYEQAEITQSELEKELNEQSQLLQQYLGMLQETEQITKEYDLIQSKITKITTEINKLNKELEQLKPQIKDLTNQYNQKKSELQELTEQMNEKKTQYSLYAKQYKKLSVVKDTCPLCGSKITSDSHIRKEQAKLQKSISTLKESYAKLKKQKTALAKIVDQLDTKLYSLNREQVKKTTTISNLSTKLSEYKSMYQKSTDYNNKITEINNKIKELQSNINKIKNKILKIQTNKDIYKFWINGFSNRGIKAYYIDSIISELNTFFNYYTKLLLNESVKLNITETYVDIEFKDKRNYSYLSTGQRKRIDLAFNFALRKLRADTILPFVVYDEIFDSLDKDGILAVIDLLSNENTDKYIFVITHDSNLKQYFNQRLLISKENNEYNFIYEK